MKFTFPKHEKNSDGTFGPTSQDHYYMTVYYHNPTAKPKVGKSRWCIKKSSQYEVFRISDEPYWFCKSNNCLFSIIKNGDIVLGKENQRLAVFPKPQNTSDSWHGWPVFSEDSKPEPKLLDRLEKEEIISSHIRRKIERGVL